MTPDTVAGMIKIVALGASPLEAYWAGEAALAGRWRAAAMWAWLSALCLGIALA